MRICAGEWFGKRKPWVIIIYEQVARNLCVDKATVCRTVALFHATGRVSKRSYPKEKSIRKLTVPAQLLILQIVLENPGMFLHEIQEKLKQFLLLEVSNATIHRCLKANGFTRQTLRTTALQRDEFLRQQFAHDVSVYSPDMLIFIDETGADRRNMIRKYGYSLRGKPLRNHTMLVRGERVSAIACMSVAGLLDVMAVTGTTDGEAFYTFVQTHLLPYLMPFDG